MARPRSGPHSPRRCAPQHSCGALSDLRATRARRDRHHKCRAARCTARAAAARARRSAAGAGAARCQAPVAREQEHLAIGAEPRPEVPRRRVHRRARVARRLPRTAGAPRDIQGAGREQRRALHVQRSRHHRPRRGQTTTGARPRRITMATARGPTSTSIPECTSRDTSRRRSQSLHPAAMPASPLAADSGYAPTARSVQPGLQVVEHAGPGLGGSGRHEAPRPVRSHLPLAAACYACTAR